MHLERDNLARRLVGDDPSIIDDLRVYFYSVLWRRIECRFGDGLRSSDRDDVMQEALIILWNKRHKFDPVRCSVLSWFGGIAFNVAKGTVRRGWAKQRKLERGLEHGELGAVSQPAGGASTADAEMDSPDVEGDEPDLLLLRACLAEMTERKRRLLLACYTGGCRASSRELAQEIGMTAAAVRQEVHRAVDKLRAAFDLRGHRQSGTRRSPGPLGRGETE